VLLVLIIGILAAYAFAKIRFPGSNFILAGLVLTMMIRPVYTMVELFRLLRTLHLIDTYWALIIVYTATSLPLALALLTAYFRSIPQDLEDAARIDGASWLTVLVRIVLPLSGPVISAVVIFTFLDAYNELLMALILLKGEHNRTLSVGLANLLGKFYKDFPELFAATAASLIPVVVVYLIFQRRFISGLMSGAIRG
jgi:ABC-type glycerol-3-phosphate transport system permease component